MQRAVNQVEKEWMSLRNEEPDYDDTHIKFLETLWGEGFLSPGGGNEVDLIIGGVDLNQKKILDFGCGCGGAILHIAEKYSASELMGVDIEASVINRATRLAATKSLERRTKFQLIERDQLPLKKNSFDVVFSKDALIHVPDKKWIFTQIFRVLKPGGCLIAGDWMTWDRGYRTAEMQEYLDAEGLDFHMSSLGSYNLDLIGSGFVSICLQDRQEWYLAKATKELNSLKNDLNNKIVGILGYKEAQRQIEVWEKMIIVLESGEHRPGHFSAIKPVSA